MTPLENLSQVASGTVMTCRFGFVNQPHVMWLVSRQDLLKTKQPIFIISDDVTGEAAG